MIDRQAWLEARRKGLGGTDAAAILGLSPWRSAIDVWEDKLGLSPEQPQTPAMLWGLLLEDAIAGAYQVETGRRVRRLGMRRAKHVRSFPMIGSLDRETYLSEAPPRVVELKTSRSDDGFAPKDGWRDLLPEKRIPPGYYVQVQHYLELTQRDVADVAVLFGGSDFRVIEIPRDPDYGADLVIELGRFWHEYVEAGIQPPVGPDDLAFLARRYPTSTTEEKVATSEVRLLVDAWLEAEAERERAETLRDGYRAKIEDFMGTAGRLVAGSGIVSWASYERRTIGWKEIVSGYVRALTQAPSVSVAPVGHPELSGKLITDDVAEQLRLLEGIHTRTSPVRPFVVRKKEEA